ncbi:MAG: DUF6455 family protein [bacterium]
MNDNDKAMAFGLTRGMARALGVNLIEAVTEGWYRRDELNALVERCARCGQGVRCRPWLAEHQRTALLPDYCRNKTELEALQL